MQISLIHLETADMHAHNAVTILKILK